jgi:DNA repair and recombination protein RAD52
VVERERTVGKRQEPGWSVTYTARVRVTVSTGDGSLVRDGVGAGHGIDVDLGQAHESAIKEAETDAFKRAIRTFGNPFGLALYDRTQANVADEPDSYQLFITQCKAAIAAFDETDRDGILRWWHSDEQRKARRDFDVNPADLLELKSLVTAKAKLPEPGAT